MATIREWGEPPDAGPPGNDGVGFDVFNLVVPMVNWPYDTWNTLYGYPLNDNEIVTLSGSIAIHHFDTQPRTTKSCLIIGSAYRAGAAAPVIDDDPFIAESGSMRQSEFRMAISGNSLVIQFTHRTLPTGTPINGNARVVLTVHNSEVP